MDETHRLLDLIPDRDAADDALLAVLDDVQAVQRVERAIQGDGGLEVHGAGL